MAAPFYFEGDNRMMIDIGFTNYVMLDKIVAVKSRKEGTREDVSFVKLAEDAGLFVDMTSGAKRKSYVLLSDGRVCASIYKSDTIRQRINRMMGLGYDEEDLLEEYPPT